MIDTTLFLLKANDSLTQIVSDLSSNQKLIDQQSASITDLNAHLSILAIWVAVVSIVLPIIVAIVGYFNYQGLNNKIYKIVEDQNRETIKLAFEKLYSANSIEVHNAAVYLNNLFEYRFSSEELKIIIGVYHRNNEFNLRHLLKTILANNPSIESDMFFRELFHNEDINSNYYNIFRYLYNSGADFTYEFIQLIEKSDSKISQYYVLISTAIFASVDIAKRLLNNDALLKVLLSSPKNEIEINLSSIGSLFKQGAYKDLIDFEKTRCFNMLSEHLKTLNIEVENIDSNTEMNVEAI